MLMPSTVELLLEAIPTVATSTPRMLNIIPIGSRRSKFIKLMVNFYQKMMFKIIVTTRTMIPNVTGCSYHGSFSDFGFGVSE